MKIRTHFKHNVFMLNEAGELLEQVPPAMWLEFGAARSPVT
jgi:hypothetical protein